MKKAVNFLKNNLLLIIFALQPVLDILAYAQRDMAVSFAGGLRLALTVIVPAYALFFTKQRKKFMVSMGIIGLFCVLHVLNGFRVGYISLFADVRYLLLVSHAVILCYSFMFLYEKEELVRQIKTAFLIIIFTVTITYYLSYFLKSGNHTYIYSKIGWTGWSNTTSVYSVIVSLLFPFMVYFCVSAKKKWCLLFLPPLAFMYLMNGTKAAYLTLIFTLLATAVFMVFEFIINRKDKFRLIVSCLLLVLMFLSVTYYNYSPRFDIDTLNNENLENKEQILMEEPTPEVEEIEQETVVNLIDKQMIERFGKKNVLKAYEGNKTAQGLSNNRLRKIVFGSLVWQETDALTKFVGFEHANMQLGEENFDLESDLPAIYFYYGYIGAVLYGGMIIYFWLRLIKQLLFHFKESFNLFNFVIFMSYGLAMLAAGYTGHLLRRPNSAIYLAIILLLIYCRTEPLFKKRNTVGA